MQGNNTVSRKDQVAPSTMGDRHTTDAALKSGDEAIENSASKQRKRRRAGNTEEKLNAIKRRREQTRKRMLAKKTALAPDGDAPEGGPATSGCVEESASQAPPSAPATQHPSDEKVIKPSECSCCHVGVTGIMLACVQCERLYCEDCGHFKPGGSDTVLCIRCQPWYNRSKSATAFCVECGKVRKNTCCDSCGRRICNYCPSSNCDRCGLVFLCGQCTDIDGRRENFFCTTCDEGNICTECCERHNEEASEGGSEEENSDV